MARKSKAPEGGGLPPWMATYGDLVTLLLCFFVLLFAFSTIDAQKFKDAVTSFKGSFGVLEGGSGVMPSNLVVVGKGDQKGTTVKYQTIAKKIKTATEVLSAEKLKELKESFNVTMTERGVVIEVEERLLFRSGQAELKKEAEDILSIVLKNIEILPNDIVIEGHTDNIPIKSTMYPSNWELSGARAASVARYFEGINPKVTKRVSIAGYADTKPKATNDNTEGRSINRRVDIVILKSLDELYVEKINNNTGTEEKN